MIAAILHKRGIHDRINALNIGIVEVCRACAIRLLGHPLQKIMRVLSLLTRICSRLLSCDQISRGLQCPCKQKER